MISCLVFIDHKDLHGPKYTLIHFRRTLRDPVIITVRSHVTAGGEEYISAARGKHVNWKVLLWYIYISRTRWRTYYFTYSVVSSYLLRNRVHALRQGDAKSCRCKKVNRDIMPIAIGFLMLRHGDA